MLLHPDQPQTDSNSQYNQRVWKDLEWTSPTKTCQMIWNLAGKTGNVLESCKLEAKRKCVFRSKSEVEWLSKSKCFDTQTQGITSLEHGSPISNLKNLCANLLQTHRRNTQQDNKIQHCSTWSSPMNSGIYELIVFIRKTKHNTICNQPANSRGLESLLSLLQSTTNNIPSPHSASLYICPSSTDCTTNTRSQTVPTSPAFDPFPLLPLMWYVCVMGGLTETTWGLVTCRRYQRRGNHVNRVEDELATDAIRNGGWWRMVEVGLEVEGKRGGGLREEEEERKKGRKRKLGFPFWVFFFG